MAYTPTEWACGDVVTAEKMNNIERGVSEIMSEYVPTEWSCGDVITAEALNKIEQGIANADSGGGDFNTAQVTLISAYGGAFSMVDFSPYQQPPYGDHAVFVTSDGQFVLSPETTSEQGETFTMIYLGDSVKLVAQDNTTQISGNVEQVPGSHAYIITGDCTLTGYQDD